MCRRFLVCLLLILVGLSLGKIALFILLFVDLFAVGTLLFQLFEAEIGSGPGHLDRLGLPLPRFLELLSASDCRHQLEVVERFVPPLDEVALPDVFCNNAPQLQIVRLHGFVDLV